MAKILIPLVHKQFIFEEEREDIDILASVISELSWGEMIELMQKVSENNDYYLSYGEVEAESFALFKLQEGTYSS